MKNLNEILNEALLNESFNNNDFNKVDNFLKNSSKLEKFIKDNKSIITSFNLNKKDIENVIDILNVIQNDLKKQGGKYADSYLYDLEENLDYNGIYFKEDLIDGIKSLYVLLFKQVTNKDLTTDKFLTSNNDNCEMSRVNSMLNNQQEINKFLKSQHVDLSTLNDLKHIYNEISKEIDPSDRTWITYDDFDGIWEYYEEKFKNLKTPNAVELFRSLWQYAIK